MLSWTRWGAASNKLLCKSAVAAANVKPSKTLRNVEPVKEHFANETSPATHEPLVGFSISEKLVSLAHCDATVRAKISYLKELRQRSLVVVCGHLVHANVETFPSASHSGFIFSRLS